MARCPGALRATRANQVVIGQDYCMWLDLDPTQGIPVKIIGWCLAPNYTVIVPPPTVMKGMNPDYTLLVIDSTTGTQLQIKDDPANGGAVYYGAKRATFHKI